MFLSVRVCACDCACRNVCAHQVNDRSRGWASARVTLLGNVNAFISGLAKYKTHVETGDVPAVNMKDVRR